MHALWLALLLPVLASAVEDPEAPEFPDRLPVAESAPAPADASSNRPPKAAPATPPPGADADAPGTETSDMPPLQPKKKKARAGKKAAARSDEDDDRASIPLVTQTKPSRGVHITGWAAGTPKFRKRIIQELQAAGLDTVVIALKEYDGKVLIKGVPMVQQIGANTGAIQDLEGCVGEFRRAGIRTVGRIVLFKDDILARKRPEWAVKTPDGGIWRNKMGIAWVDPYRSEVWEYNLAIASRAAQAGFDEIQFDYVRFPSDGNVSLCRYSRPDHTPRSAGWALHQFLVQARAALKPYGVDISVCLFGMTSSARTDMGIGQRIGSLAEDVETVSPMMYPSHYYKGELGVKNPNREPYRIIRRSLRDAVARLGPHADKLRPYFQDFSLGVRYDADKVRAQLLAARALGVTNWILWNPQNRYTWKALKLDGRNIWDLPPEQAVLAAPGVSGASTARAGVPPRTELGSGPTGVRLSTPDAARKENPEP